MRPDGGPNLKASELRFTIRTSAPGRLAVFCSVGRRSFVNSAGPIWFVPN